MILTRRHLLAATTLTANPARAAVPRFEPAPDLAAAAKREGRVVLYTAQIEELEQEMINEFNHRFPFVRVEMVHAPGGQLITRIRSEMANGKLVADIIDHSDPNVLKPIEDAFRDYAPPNAADWITSVMVSPKLWPRLTVGWCIAWNSEIISQTPTSWWDLMQPQNAGQLGQATAFAGGSSWTRIMFERKVLGEDYWAKQAALKPRIYPTVAATTDALIRGEVAVAPVTYAIVVPKQRDGAPLKSVFPKEGVPSFIFASGITKTAANPAAARLYLDWCLSAEGQAFLIQELGHMTALKVPPVQPAGLDTGAGLWFPDRTESDRLRVAWLEEWSKLFGVRQ